MARLELLTIVAIVSVLTMPFGPVSALKCWVCDSKNYIDCGDPFNSNLLPESLLVECPPAESGTRACVKAKVESTGIVHRLCSDKGIPSIADFGVSVSCSYEHAFIVDNVKHVDYSADTCETCAEDGCNGAATYGPIALLIAAPVALMKILSL